MERRFGDAASITYHNTSDTNVREKHADVIDEIERRGLLYPVTVIDGMPLYDGAVSYPAILRAVQNKLNDRVAAD